MTDETPWGHLQRLFEQNRRFEEALPALQEHGLNGEDLAVLLNNPASQLVAWMREGAGDTPVELNAVEPPSGAPLPPRRTGNRGFLGWLSGATAIEGLGLFTESDVFELCGVQFAVMAEPLREVVYGELVPLRVLALNCTSEPRALELEIDAERGLLQSPRRYVLSLEPGVISLAVLPLRICPSSLAVAALQAVFEVNAVTSRPRWRFSARSYAKPARQLLSAIAGATVAAAAVGLSPVYLASSASSDQGSPDPIRLRPNLARPLVAPRQEPVLWRLLRLT